MKIKPYRIFEFFGRAADAIAIPLEVEPMIGDNSPTNSTIVYSSISLLWDHILKITQFPQTEKIVVKFKDDSHDSAEDWCHYMVEPGYVEDFFPLKQIFNDINREGRGWRN